MIKRNKKWSIAIAIAAGTLSFAAYVWHVPEELHRAIFDSVIMACTLIQTLDNKQAPPDEEGNPK
ncbi:hypothetical protein [Laspinema palackyanum]|uniref:hypothetical protein n=1 Tax=Laspinema palackyanum TaxID=3231601 RepID=UPI00345DE5C4|nr:hypothetical protein [Laspinema sp. D2c]